MSLVSRLTSGLKTRAGEPRGTGSMFSDAGLLRSLSSAGRTVTTSNAIGISAYWAAIWLIADQGSSLPLRIFERRGNELEPATGGAVIPQWVSQPNPECSPTDVWSVVLAHMEGWGNAFLGKQISLGRVVALWPIHPDRVTVRRERGQKVFDVLEDDGGIYKYTSAEIVHIKGRSLDGFIGVSPIHVHRNTLGVALALDDFAGDTFRNRAIPPGILSVKGRITDPNTKDEMREEWHSRYGRGGATLDRDGEPRDRRIAILDEDARFEALSIPLVDAQFIEQRNYSVQDVARIVGVAPEDIGGESGGGMDYTNVQARRADLLQFRLWPRLKRIEGALLGDAALFPRAALLEPHFDDTAFLRGDPREQYETLHIATGGKPILTQDEARGMVGKGALGGTAAELDFKSAPATLPAKNTPTKEA